MIRMPSLTETPPLVVKMEPVIHMSDAKLFAFCRLNRDLRIERTAEGEIIIMAPAGGETGRKNLALGAAVYEWAQQDGQGVAFDSSTGFILPSGAMRAPDVSWVRRSRLLSLTPEEKQQFLPVCPDFVIELRSPSDRLGDLKDKMQEYIENGAQLGWLLDPTERQLYVYQPDSPVATLKNPAAVSGDPLLPGFTLNLSPIWETDF